MRRAVLGPSQEDKPRQPWLHGCPGDITKQEKDEQNREVSREMDGKEGDGGSRWRGWGRGGDVLRAGRWGYGDFGHGRNSDSAQSNAKGTQVGTEVSTVSASASTISDSSQTDLSLSAQFNESLRWDGILEDPAAEEERLQTYRLNRRKRYELYLQQHHPTAGHPPSLRSHHTEHRCSSFPRQQTAPEF
uniref:Uncharacterized protein n=1 Tax=Phasianus colchicus TaxID=9054 RepID=A0A669PIK5_PHACC